MDIVLHQPEIPPNTGNVARLSRDLHDLGIKASRNMPPLTRQKLENDDETPLSLDETGSVEHQSE